MSHPHDSQYVITVFAIRQWFLLDSQYLELKTTYMCLIIIFCATNIVVLVSTSRKPFQNDPLSWCTRYLFKGICSIKLVASFTVHVPKDPPTKTSNIILVWGHNPWKNVCICVNSPNPCPIHHFTRNLYLSQSPYNLSASFYSKLVISAFFWINLEIGKYLSRNLSSNSSQIFIILNGMNEIQCLSLPFKVKWNNFNLLAFSFSREGYL